MSSAGPSSAKTDIIDMNLLDEEDHSIPPNNVSSIILHGVPIVSLHIDGKERLCLAQISNTLLKEYSYNEIHNRRVALGITCVQCTPVQLEILRRAGAMPISSRRCGMITKREAERLVKSFLEEHMPPKLPDNFAFRVKHTCGWGCFGQFIPNRYNSSRAKCIKCSFCNLFFSPNKFIFHFHRMPDASYRHPDAANFNSWRRHLHLDYDSPSEELTHAWEDVKAMFNGGSRKRVISISSPNTSPDSDNMYSPTKRSCFPIDDANIIRKSNANTSSYPFLPMQGVSPPHMMFPFSMPPTHPMLPAPPTDDSEKHKVKAAESWKHRSQLSPMYNPFGLLWAKSLGMIPFSNSMKTPYLDRHHRNPFPSQSFHSSQGQNERLSAFKPVSMFDARFTRSYNSHPAVYPESTNTSKYFGVTKYPYVLPAEQDTLQVSQPENKKDGDKAEDDTTTGDFEDSERAVSPSESEVCVEEMILDDIKRDVSDMSKGTSVTKTADTTIDASFVNVCDSTAGRSDTKKTSKDAYCNKDGVKLENTGSPKCTTVELDERQKDESHLQTVNSKQGTGSAIYEMSKEELQRELMRMIQTRDQQ